jgi:hypothetical protein
VLIIIEHNSFTIINIEFFSMLYKPLHTY